MQLTDQFRRRTPVEIGVMSLVFFFLLLIIYTLIPDAADDIKTNYCPQPEIQPWKGHGFNDSSFFYTPEYRDYSVKAMQGAIQVPSVSYDDMKMDVRHEPRFHIFKKLHKYLWRTFPRAAEQVEVVNEYGLLYTFKGKNSNLKPAVFMAHQDVVPVNDATLDEWDYPPFEGHFDGEFLYGRGTADTKDSLVGILEAVESLLVQGWTPERTLILSFGFDEEISGGRGARTLAEELERRYGNGGIELVIDEGSGLAPVYGSLIGAVTVAEKGYVDIIASLNTPGGHSSVPPDHTGIGIMSQLVKLLEDHPFPSELEDSNPTVGFFRCLAEHSNTMTKTFRRVILDLDSGKHRKNLVNHIEKDPNLKYWIRTSQAADVIKGGVKVNALPERVELMVNHRISPSSGVAAVVDRFEDLVVEIAEQFGLGVESHGETLLDTTARGLFNITTATRLDPAPISPHVGYAWDLIGSTTRSIVESFPFAESKDVVMAPALFPANTDTRHYWNLSRAIYRYKPVLIEDAINFHTVNEKLRFRSHLMTVAWYYEFIIQSTL